MLGKEVEISQHLMEEALRAHEELHRTNEESQQALHRQMIS